MRTVVSADEMRQCDETAIHSYRIPSLVLMENAGAGVARTIAGRFGPLEKKRMLLLCGKGNNAGDGFVVARHCLNAGATIDVLLLDSPSAFKGDAKTNFMILQRFAKDSGRLNIRKYTGGFAGEQAYPDVIVDAIFGTGFKGDVKKPYSHVIEWTNNQASPVVAIDIPSGLNGTTGQAGNTAVRASLTVTMGALKTGLLCNRGRDLAGEIEVVDIGIPQEVFRRQSFKTRVIESRDVGTLLPRRASTAHKYSVGKVFVLAGSKGYTGAAALAAQAALRSGAGAVVLGTPETVYPILARKLSEVIVRPLPSTGSGSLGLKGIEEIKERMAWADVSVIGPGLSQEEETQRLIQNLVMQSRGKILLDADGLNAVSAVGARRLKKSAADLVLTPHTGELSRLLTITSAEIDSDRVRSARTAAAALGCLVVLKGAPTATANPEGDVFLNPTGNPGMATVGAGDVLSGIIGALWAQGMKHPAEAFSGVYLHGLSGDMAKGKLGEQSLVAQDLIDFLPSAFQVVQGAA